MRREGGKGKRRKGGILAVPPLQIQSGKSPMKPTRVLEGSINKEEKKENKKEKKKERQTAYQ